MSEYTEETGFLRQVRSLYTDCHKATDGRGDSAPTKFTFSVNEG